MEPRRPKHKQLPPLQVEQEELEQALSNARNYHVVDGDDSGKQDDAVELFPSGTEKSIQVIHTHMSMVFLLPERVYKVKKSVDYGFADFSTLYKRFQACLAEVQLNQRLAPDVYMGVVPIAMDRATRQITVRCEDFWSLEKQGNLDWWMNDTYGEIVEWAVHMVRLPDSRTLEAIMAEGRLSQSVVAHVATRIATFHANARRGPRVDPFGAESVVQRNVDENFAQTQSHAGVTVDRQVYQRVKQLTYEQLKELSSTITQRMGDGLTCDSHGDLRLEHIYALPLDDDDTDIAHTNRSNGQCNGSGSTNECEVDGERCRLVVLDCIEFNEQFRYGDPLSDAAFLMMDIWHQGRPDLARSFQNEYLRHANQHTAVNARLFRFYAAYRAVVRAKVTGFRVMDKRLDQEHRERETQRARAFWMLALTLLSSPASRPAMLLLSGLPASGKSTLARMLADAGHGTWFRADAVRKELAASDTLGGAKVEQQANGNEPQQEAATQGGSFEEGLYAPGMTQRTYDEILDRSVQKLRMGERVIVDATFRDPKLRQRFMDIALREGVPFVFVVCECDREITRGRLLARKKDLSDATWDVYEMMEREWDFPDQFTMPECFTVNTEDDPEVTLRRTSGFLRKQELL